MFVVFSVEQESQLRVKYEEKLKGLMPSSVKEVSTPGLTAGFPHSPRISWNALDFEKKKFKA